MKRILVVDDDTNLRLLLRTTLEDSEVEVIEAADGNEALEVALKERPDLVVLDWMMPGMTGLELTRRLRADARTARMPIILLTAKGQDDDRAEGLEAGADHFLVKPFSPLELLEKIQRVLD